MFINIAHFIGLVIELLWGRNLLIYCFCKNILIYYMWILDTCVQIIQWFIFSDLFQSLPRWFVKFRVGQNLPFRCVTRRNDVQNFNIWVVLHSASQTSTIRKGYYTCTISCSFKRRSTGRRLRWGNFYALV